MVCPLFSVLVFAGAGAGFVECFAASAGFEGEVVAGNVEPRTSRKARIGFCLFLAVDRNRPALACAAEPPGLTTVWDMLHVLTAEPGPLF